MSDDTSIIKDVAASGIGAAGGAALGGTAGMAAGAGTGILANLLVNALTRGKGDDLTKMLRGGALVGGGALAGGTVGALGGQHVGADMATGKYGEANELNKQGNDMSNIDVPKPYLEGFEDKCAEFGIDPAKLVETVGAMEGEVKQALNFGEGGLAVSGFMDDRRGDQANHLAAVRRGDAYPDAKYSSADLSPEYIEGFTAIMKSAGLSDEEVDTVCKEAGFNYKDVYGSVIKKLKAPYKEITSTTRKDVQLPSTGAEPVADKDMSLAKKILAGLGIGGATGAGVAAATSGDDEEVTDAAKDKVDAATQS